MKRKSSISTRFFALLFFIFIATVQVCCSQVKDSGIPLSEYMKQNGYISIQLFKNITGHLYTKIIMNNVDGSFILDTGAGSTVMEEKRKEKFMLTATAAREKAAGAGGSNMSMKISIGNKFKIGNYIADNYTIMLMNLDHVNNAYKQLGVEEVDGVLGADILTSGKAVIDYANLILYLKNGDN